MPTPLPSPREVANAAQPRRRLSDQESLDSRVARLEAHWEDLIVRLDRQFAELAQADSRAQTLIEKLDQRVDAADADRAKLRAELQVFIARVVVAVVVVIGLGQTILTLFGPAIRAAFGLPQT